MSENTLFLVAETEHHFFKDRYPHVIMIKKVNNSKTIEDIVNYVDKNKLNKIFTNCHCKNHHQILAGLESRKLSVDIYATHQKNYIHPTVIPKLKNILEYAPKASQRSFSQYFNKNENNKYLHFNFPTYISDRIIRSLRKKKVKHYYFTGGVNGRDYATLIKAFSKTHHRLIICAKPDMKGKMKRYSNLPPNITWIENIPRIKFLKLLAHAKAVILPIPPGRSVVGHTLLSEAIVLGKPVISVNEHSLVENLDHANNSIVIKNKVKGYLNALGYLDKPKNYQRMQANMKKIQNSRLLSKHFEFIESLLKK